MTNRAYIIYLLLDGLGDEANFKRVSSDDDGASYEAMVYYNIACPYYEDDERCLCEKEEAMTREICYRCKEEWLNSEVEQ